jgi:hypothetical protein
MAEHSSQSAGVAQTESTRIDDLISYYINPAISRFTELSTSDKIAVISLGVTVFSVLIAIFAWSISKKAYRSQIKSQGESRRLEEIRDKIDYSIKLTPLIDGDSINDATFDGVIRPSYYATLVMNRGNLSLKSCGFYIKRNVDGEIIRHALPGSFSSGNDVVKLGPGEGTEALPSNKRRMRELLADATHIMAEFQSLFGDPYRSAEIEIPEAHRVPKRKPRDERAEAGG